MNFQSVINGRMGISLGLLLGRILTPSLADRIARRLGPWLAARKDFEIVKAARINQWVVGGEKYNSIELDAAVAASFTNSVTSMYRFYRYFRDPAALEELVEFPRKLAGIIQENMVNKRGLILAGVHLGNFDLVMQALIRSAPPLPGGTALALSVPNPGKGYERQNDFRRESGLEIIPASLSAIKLAAQHLNEGGIVISGLDRPLPGSRYKPRFFNRPAAVPVLHVPLALRTKSPLVVIGAVARADGGYQIFVSDPLELKEFPDRNQEIIRNAEAVLEIAETYIGGTPSQWALYYPIWPEVITQLPA